MHLKQRASLINLTQQKSEQSAFTSNQFHLNFKHSAQIFNPAHPQAKTNHSDFRRDSSSFKELRIHFSSLSFAFFTRCFVHKPRTILSKSSLFSFLSRRLCFLSLVFLFAGFFVFNSDAQAQEEVTISLDDAEEADVHFRLGSKAYNKGKYQEALKHFLASQRLVPNANTNYNIGLAYEANGQSEQAVHHYYDVMHSSSDPDLKAEVEKAIDRIGKKSALIKITSDPPGADVYIDRENLGLRGHTPFLIALTPEPHHIFLKLDGYKNSETKDILVNIGEKREVYFKLEPLTSFIKVDGNPIGADVTVLGQKENHCTLPCEMELRSAETICEIKAPHYKTQYVPIHLMPQQTTTFSVSLEPNVGSIEVTADVLDAQIKLDGKMYGYTPLRIDRVFEGSHVIEISHSGYETISHPIEVKNDAISKYHAEMHTADLFYSSSSKVQTLDEVAASVDSISDREIRVFGYETVYDALLGSRSVTGRFEGEYHNLVMRGFSVSNDNGSRLLVKWGNHNMNIPGLGISAVDRSLMPSLGNVKRIELLRGPASSIYGSGASLGLINILAKDDNDGIKPQIEIAHQEARSLRIRLVGSHHWSEKGGIWISGDFFKSQGDDYDLEQIVGIDQARSNPKKLHFITNTVSVEDKESDDIKNLAMRIWQGDTSLQMDYKLRDHYMAIPAKGTIINDPNLRTQEHRATFSLDYTPHLDEALYLSLHSYADWAHNQNDYPFEKNQWGMNKQTFDSLWAGFEGRAKLFPKSNRFKLMMGLELRKPIWIELNQKRQDHEASSEPDQTSLFSLFSEGEIQLLQPLSLTLGARADFFDLDDFEISPRTSLILRLGAKNVIKTMFNMAYHQPTLQERFLNQLNEESKAKAELKRERSWTGELEYTRKLPLDFKLISSVYYRQVEDLITVPFRASSSQNPLFRNQSQNLYTLGGDIELRREWHKNWFTEINYSFQRTRLRHLLDGDELLNSPAHLFNVKLAAPMNRMGINIANRFRVESGRLLFGGDHTVEAYYWDVILTPIDLIMDTFDFSFGFINILNWKNEQSASPRTGLRSIPISGRSVQMSVKAQF